MMKAQQDKDNAIRDLYKTMMRTLKSACEKDRLNQRDELREHFENMTKMAIQCSLFISGYSSGRYYRTLKYSYTTMKHRDINRFPLDSERLTRLEVEKEIFRFKESFQVWEAGLSSRIARTTMTIMLEIREGIDLLSESILHRFIIAVIKLDQ
jgi:hypothetical protein